MSTVDGSLLLRAIEGDATALEQLLEQHAAALRSSLAGKIPTRYQALLAIDDVLQQTYTDAFLDIRHFEPRGDDSLGAWLVTLARRNLHDALRMLEADKRGGGRQAISNPDDSQDCLIELLSASSATPSRHAARGETRAALHRAVSGLPEPHRQVIELYDLQGQSVQDVAQALQRSRGAVFMLRARALRWLADLLGSGSQFFSHFA